MFAFVYSYGLHQFLTFLTLCSHPITSPATKVMHALSDHQYQLAMEPYLVSELSVRGTSLTGKPVCVCDVMCMEWRMSKRTCPVIIHNYRCLCLCRTWARHGSGPHRALRHAESTQDNVKRMAPCAEKIFAEMNGTLCCHCESAKLFYDQSFGTLSGLGV